MPTSGAEDGHSCSVSPNDSGGEAEGAEMAEHRQDREDGLHHNGHHQPSSNAKDPLRPRRKKARRACFACQRAHLTCGDERPCQRCIKRGLQEACHDGVRKRAKYLHDAPNEALLPGAGDHHHHHHHHSLFDQAATTQHGMPVQNTEVAQQESGQFYPNPQSFSGYPSSRPMPPPPPMLQDGNTISAQNFAHQSPISPAFAIPAQQPLHTTGLPQPQPRSAADVSQTWTDALIDPNHPGVFNFDLASMNFGNHYGALEFGMLGHMVTGADQASPGDSATQRGSVGHTSGSPQYSLPLASFGESPTQHFAYNDATMSEWSQAPTQFGQHFSQPSDSPHAFAIETRMPPFVSSELASSPQQGFTRFENSPSMAYQTAKLPPTPTNGVAQASHRPSAPGPEGQFHQPSPITTPQLRSRDHPHNRHAKRRRDPSSIYNNVTAPYSYTSGFHSLIAYLQRRFSASPARTLAIAQSLASIRPSFIATTKTLNHDDLIFMEKCFQRTLWEYEGFIEGVGTPTIVARRTGEVAAVGKEFSILTGWKKDVLLGREPNLNVNRGGGTSGGSAPGTGTNSASRGTGKNTPIQRGGVSGPRDTLQDSTTEGQRLQPVFLAELLDDDSVVEFYEGFARLAFGDSRGSVMGKGKLLKYRTREDLITQNLQENGTGAAGSVASSATGEMTINDVQNQTQHSSSSARNLNGGTRQQKDSKRSGIADEREMSQRLGERDGKVECTICWTVKRDVFDIPMLIIMNFLPCI